MTLTELLVSMTIMSIVMVIFTAGIIQVYRSANAIDARATAQSQINLAFMRLDKEIRYSNGIGLPYLVSGAQRVEFVLVGTGTAQCVQLRVSGSQLQQRTWTYQSSPVVPTAWTTLASGVTSSQPFSYVAPSDDIGYQRLRIRLIAVSGSGPTQATKNTDITITAVNTTRNTSTGVCTEGQALP